MITDELLTHLQKLASLGLNQEESQTAKAHLNEIIAFIENINQLDLRSQSATFHPLTSHATLREDCPLCDEQIPQQILSHAPQAQEGFFIVPKIIE